MLMNSSNPKSKTKAQAMVEFALVLPILLLVIYGLLEAGRLLFIFASVNTASRQAVRYGSAIGLVDTDGDGNLDTPHYEDCAGITAAANNVAFIAPFTNVNITYDRGLNPDGSIRDIDGIGSDPVTNNTCPTLVSGQVRDGDRVSVYVSAQFAPIIPFLPLGPMTIESAASRTIVGEISIHVTAVPQGWDPASGEALALNLEIIPSPATYSYVGDTITYTYKITNIGVLDVAGLFSVTDNTFSTKANCSGAAASLTPGESTTCTYTHTITQTDIDNGSLTNVARALGTAATSNQATATVTFLPMPKLTLLEITPNPTEAFTVGTLITYLYTFQNTGNVALGPFSVNDDTATSTTCSGETSPLPPGGPTTCSGSFLLTATHINRGYVSNIASIRAADGTVSNSASAFVLTTKLFLADITASPASINAAGQVVTITYTLQNKGSINITSINSLSGTNVQDVKCSGANLPFSLTLPPGSNTTCTSTYVVQQSDIDAGSFTLEATATATASGDSLTSNPRSISVPAIQSPVLELTISATPNPVPDTTNLVTYTYTLKNNGNVSLKNFTIADTVYGNLVCSDPTTPLAPTQTRTCFIAPAAPVTRSITAEDRANGSIKNQATARAYYGTGVATTQSALASYILITFNAPRITLTLTANPTAATVGEQVTFTFVVKNTGNTNLSPFTLTRIAGGPDLQLFGCTPSALGIGDSQTCIASFIASATFTTTWQATAPEAANPSQSSTTVTVTEPVGCDPRHNALKTSPFSFTIFNNNPIQTITISNIQIFWNNETGQDIQGILLGGLPIWSGNEHSNPASFSTFTGNVTIGPSANKQLLFTFKKAYVANGTERVLVFFAEAGCPILDTSNPGQLP